MKNLKKYLGILIAVVAMLTLSVCVNASQEPKTYTITIDNNNTGHTYTAYQIFSGKLSEKENTLTNLTWGSGITAAGQSNFGDAQTKADALKTVSDAEAFANAIVDGEYLASGKSVSSTPYVISGLEPGYYLIVDEATDRSEPISQHLLKVVEDVTANPKVYDFPIFIKKVDDINDSTGVEELLQDTADHDIGDWFNFTLQATLPTGYASYRTYYLEFEDDMSDGLTLKTDSFVVTVDDTVVNSGYTITTSESDPDDFYLVFEDLKKAVPAAHAGSVVKVTYLGKLNEGAVIGRPGNPNKAKLIFNRNPNWNGEGKPDDTGETEWDVVFIYTYETIIDKVDKDGNPLSGAEFKLEKLVDGTWVTLEFVKAEKGESFSFTGMDDGKYRVTETKAPDGYNSLTKAIEFEVKATHTVEQESDGNAISLKTLTVEMAQDSEFTFTASVENGTVNKTKGTKNLTSGQIYTEVVNQAGASLPETGGIGTTLFYVIGAVLVLGAVVLMITKKRMDSEK